MKPSLAGYQIDGYGSCEGDSGSPVVQFDTSRRGASHYVQVRKDTFFQVSHFLHHFASL